MKYFKKISIVAAFVISLVAVTGCGPSTYFATGTRYVVPAWAPPYSADTRYYYFPDIETYYDLSTEDFVYLDNGQWLFSHSLPPVYSGFDLYGGFVITLNIDVFQPWMHHQYYISHYPRYYYNNVYKGVVSTIRGFNEHGNRPIYWGHGERERINELRKNDRGVIKTGLTRPPQKTNYQGRNIGRPVRVKPSMREIIKKHGRP